MRENVLFFCSVHVDERSVFGLAERLLGEARQPYLRKGQREDLVLLTKDGLRMEGEKLRRDANPVRRKDDAAAL